MRKSIWLAGIILSLVFHSCSPKQEKPNIILLLTDDQRFDAVGYAGNVQIKTPNIDNLANEGVIFENAFVTTSICFASRASILSGQYALRHGIHGFHTDFSDSAMAQTYPLQLKEKAGYQIGFIGKYGIGLKGHPADKFDYWGCERVHQPHYENIDSTGKMHHYTDIVNGRIIDFLDEYANQGPFCLSVSFKAPHVEDKDPRQFVYHERYKDLYSDINFAKAENATDSLWYAYSSVFRKNNEARKRWRMRFETDSIFQESVRGYYRLITGIDDVVGNMMNKLNELNIDENTIIVFLSDNGFFLGERGMAGKWYAHNESVRIPMFIYQPELDDNKKGQKLHSIALNIDIAPTILDMAGVDAPIAMQGESLLKLINGNANDWRTAFFYEHRLPNPRIPKSEAYIGENYKFIHYYELPDSNIEMYNVTKDELEMNNLAYDREYQLLVKVYQSKLDSIKNTAK